MIRIAVALALCASWLSTPAQEPKAPIPPADEQEKARKDLKDAYKAEYAKRAKEDKRTFARKLLDEGAAEKQPTMKYVLLQEAREIAAEAADPSTALAAIDVILKDYDAKADALLTPTLSAVKKAVRSEEDANAVVGVCLASADRAAAAGSYESAVALATAARDAAKAVRDPAVGGRVQSALSEINEARKEYERSRKAEEALQANGEDAAANLDWGRFLCFFRNDWTKGLPMLGKGSEAGLRELSKKELETPTTPEGKAALAIAWTEAATKEKSPYKRKSYERAAYWIEQAWPGLPDREKARLERKLEEIENGAGRVNLLLAPLSAVSGVWGLTGSIKAPGGTVGTSVEILYVPPPEYDLEVRIKPLHVPEFTMGLVAGNSRFTVSLDSRNGSAIHVKGDKVPDDSKFTGEAIPDDKVTALLFSVRKSGVTVAADGRTLMRWAGPFSSLGVGRPDWKPKHPNTLFVGFYRNFAGSGEYEIVSMTLTPLVGRGQRIR